MQKSKVPADKQSIDQIEKNFGIRLPSDFRQIAIISHGTQPSPDTIDFGDLKNHLLQTKQKNEPHESFYSKFLTLLKWDVSKRRLKISLDDCIISNERKTKEDYEIFLYNKRWIILGMVYIFIIL